MDFHFNKQKACPDCGCNTVIEEKIKIDGDYHPSLTRRISEHCNGGRWETRTFLCGYSCQYVPNFSRNERVFVCQNTREYKAKAAEKENLRKKIAELESKLRAV